MRINKAYIKNKDGNKIGFVSFSFAHMSISAAVRDWIIPHTRIFVDIDNSGNLIITPTNDPNGFVAYISKTGQMKVSALTILKHVDVVESVRYKCFKREDGLIIVDIKGGT